MRTMIRHLIPNAGSLIIIGLLFLTQSVAALPGSAPVESLVTSQSLISYQGSLTDNSGGPVNATLAMEFALYDAASGGNLLWGPETHAVQVADGLFHVLLGSLTPLTPANLMEDVYLEVTVEGETLAPREVLTSVAFSLQAQGVTAPLEVPGKVLSSGASGGLFAAQNPNNSLATVNLGWSDDVARIRVAGNEAGASNGFHIQGPGDKSLLRILGNGRIGIGTVEPTHGQVQIETSAVPLAFRETDQTGAGSLWRVPLDGKHLRFDASQNGTDFAGYETPLTLYADGSLGCGALTEANLQTDKERAAGGIDRFEEGDVLCWGIDQLELCDTPGDRLVQAVADKGGRPIVIGAEPVKVLGPVRRGDTLVASDVPGYAMVNNDPISGSVIAQALEGFDGEMGIIKAMIRKF